MMTPDLGYALATKLQNGSYMKSEFWTTANGRTILSAGLTLYANNTLQLRANSSSTFNSPLVTGYTGILAFVTVFHEKLTDFRISISRNHVVIAGCGYIGNLLRAACSVDNNAREHGQ